MPSFTIEGNPGSVRSKASGMRTHAQTFTQTGDALATITTDGWISRSGERFREKFETEPDRWRDAGAGWQRAAAGLETFAGELERAQERADWSEREYARGEQVTRDARAAYDADVDRAQGEAAQQRAAGMTVNLTILPFEDPGEEVRQGALREYESAKSDLDAAAQDCASEVKAGCADAPEKRKWYEKVGGAVAGFFAGAGEALADLGKLAYFLTMPHIAIPMMLMDDLNSGLTTEEIAAKYQLKLEDAKAIGEYAVSDPVGFGKTLGKAVLDWDTWADDPARAAGRLLPDAVIAVLTAGTGTAATRGAAATRNAVKGLDKLDDLAALRHLDDVPGGGRGAPDAPGGVPTPGGGSPQSLSDVRTWLDDINGADKIDWSDPGERGVNCGKCALAVHERFEGSTTSTADLGTLSVRQMEDATGRTQVSMAPDDIAQHLRDQGPGSHAVVGVDRAQGAGHWFNAYFDGDKVVAVDGQTGEILDWPPDMGDVVHWDVGVEP